MLPDVKPRLLVSMHWRASSVCLWLSAPPRLLVVLVLAVAAADYLFIGLRLQAQQA